MARHVGVAERPRDLLDDVVHPVGLGANVGPVRRHDDREPPVVAGVFQDRETDRLNETFDLLASELDPDLAVHTGDRHRDHERLGDVAAHVEHPVGHTETGDALGQQLAEAPYRRLDAPRITAAFETRRGLGPQTEALGGAGDRHGREVGRLEQDLGRALGDLRRRRRP